MDEIETPAARPLRRHLLAPQQLASPLATVADLPGHRQGNGLHVHSVYFGVVSLVALAMVVLAIAISMR